MGSLPSLPLRPDSSEAMNIKESLEKRHKLKLLEVEVSYSDSIESAFCIAPIRLPRFISKKMRKWQEAKWRHFLKIKRLEDKEGETADPYKYTIFLPRIHCIYPVKFYGALWHEFGHVLADTLYVKDKTHNEGIAFACGFRGLLLEVLEGKFTIEEAIDEIEFQIKRAENSLPFFHFNPHRSAMRVIKEYNVERGCFEDWQFRNRDPHILIAELDEKIQRAVRDDREVREIVAKRKIANAEKPFVAIFTIIIAILLTYSIVSNLI